MTETEYFLSKVSPEPNSGCWLWAGSQQAGGYGAFHYNGATERAHRAAWRIFHKSHPGGLFVCHKCDVPACVNPSHLFLGNAKDNARDAVSKGRNTFGELNTRAGVTTELVIKIKSMPRHINHVEVATMFGLNRDYVAKLRNGVYWQHLNMHCVPTNNPKKFPQAGKD